MIKLDLTSLNTKTKIFLGFLLVLSITALVLGVRGCLSYTPSQFLILSVTLVTSIIVSQYELRISQAKATLSVKEAVVFWAIIWLGVPGGILVSACAAIASYPLFAKDKKRWVTFVFSNIISTFVSATVFYEVLNRFAGMKGSTLSVNMVEPMWLIGSVLMMGALHILLHMSLTSTFLKLDREHLLSNSFKEIFVSSSISYVWGVILTFIADIVFLNFGPGFGLFIVTNIVIAHAAYRLHVNKLAQKTREITEASRIHLATVDALATAIDARDQVGIGHVRRTQIYAIGIGEILGLPDTDIQALSTGALLHDIGKLGVPDHILNKPGRLTPAEMEKMKIHATIGASILDKVDFPYPVVSAVRHHHESWDGTGYPDGLKKEDIPLTARILAVADAYDTLRGARPYREAVSRDEARRFLLNGSGTQFDPKIIDVFLRNLRQFEGEVDAEGLAYALDSSNEILDSLNLNHSNDSKPGYVEQIKRANREVFALYELARVFSSSLNVDDTLKLFVQKIAELMPFDSCVVYLLDKSQEFATARYAEGKNSTNLKGKRIKAGEGATGYVLKKRQAVYNINPALDFSFTQLDFIQDYTAMASLPLIADEVMLGAVSLYSCSLENYVEEHMRLLETVSRIAADAISKALHFKETETNALTDPMTQLPNARSLHLHFENEASRARRSNEEFQLLMLDLDGFKKVNDTFGHAIGDQLLREIAAVMREQLREYDFLARYAGDEFVAIIPETSNADIQDLCQRIESAVSGFGLPIGDGRFAKVGISIGAACYPRHGESLDQIIIAADQAMYSVKATHKQNLSQPQRAVSENMPNTVNPEENFIVELDESHIIPSTNRIN